ncbi:hypothetical protein M1446_03750 [Candidatus Dependentiae bacterium]|nr:hypothetical protein [Candidatus Dependentiae bacterium]
MRAIKENLIAGILENPGCFSYLHGDAQPGNFFINNQEDKIVMIDLAGATKYFDTQKRPTGFAAHEYYQFLSSLDRASLHHVRVSAEELRLFKKSFESGYNTYKQQDEITTQESLSFFKFYWTLRGVQDDLLYLKYLSKDAPLYSELLNDLHLKLHVILNLGS